MSAEYILWGSHKLIGVNEVYGVRCHAIACGPIMHRYHGVKRFTATVPVSGHASFIGTVGNLPQTDKIRDPQNRPRDDADFRAGARPTKGDCVLQKLLFAAVAASTLLSATLAFAQPAGFTPTRYGTKAFETNSQQSQSMTSGEKGSGQPQIESGSVSGKVTPVQSHKTPG
jgi:hypothetical protein